MQYGFSNEIMYTVVFIRLGTLSENCTATQTRPANPSTGKLSSELHVPSSMETHSLVGLSLHIILCHILQ